MSRSIRVQFEGARYHVINRGNFRKDLFSTYRTAEAFSKTLFETCDRFEWWLHAYVIMGNHFHLCLETPNANLIDGMHWLQSSFANRFSAFSHERGHVFQGRYKSLVIEGDFGLLNVADYIHLNPVRSRSLSVEQLRRYSHSSFPKYFSKIRHPRLRCEDFLSQAGDLKPGPVGMRSYHNRLKLIMAEGPEKRKLLFESLTTGWYIGTPEGKLRLSERVNNREIEATQGAETLIATRDYESLMNQGLIAVGKTSKDIREDNKSALWKIALATWIKERTSAKNRQISEYLNMGHPATMSNHLTVYRRGSKGQCPYAKKLKRVFQY